jgi:CRP/FNR family cyclic AMP-dependent transcriptional regulator
MMASPLLASIALFDGLSAQDLDALAGALESRTFAAGATIFTQGDIGSSMYIVERGEISIFLPDGQSPGIALRSILPGEYFGELALFDDKPRSASALASSDVLLYELPRAPLQNYLEDHPRAALAILRSISARLRETNALLSSRAAKNVNEEFEKSLSWSDRLADVVAELNGSWKFILLLLGFTLAWCLINTGWMMQSPLDPYPYQFFNLALAILVGLQGPLIVMSQNRQSRKDRARSDGDFNVNLKNEVNIEILLREVGELRAELKSDRAISSKP